MKSPEEYKDGLTGVNAKYDTAPTLGSYRTSETPFPNPEGEVLFAGFGADDKDLERGWCDPHVTELPNYDKINYHERYTMPKLPDEDQGNRQSMSQDMEFRMKERESKGFLTRPRIPTER